MGDLAAILLTFGILVVILGGLPWLASVVRRRGVGGGVWDAIEELWYPAAARARRETAVEIQQERRAPAPAPGDPPFTQINDHDGGTPGQQNR